MGNNCSVAAALKVAVKDAEPPRRPDLECCCGPRQAMRNWSTGESFTLFRATVRNRRTSAQASSTTLRYYRSADASDLDAPTMEVGHRRRGPALRRFGRVAVASRRSFRRRWQPASYYFGACVDAVTDESECDEQLLVLSGGCTVVPSRLVVGRT